MTTFSGFSEEELNRIKSGETSSNSDPQITPTNVRKLYKLGFKSERANNSSKKFTVPTLQKRNSDDALDNNEFEKCKLSIRFSSAPASDIENNYNNNKENVDKNVPAPAELTATKVSDTNDEQPLNDDKKDETIREIDGKDSLGIAPDIVRGVDNYSEDDLVNHKVKLEELQLRQKLMEEQNKKRKEMLAKALAHRTKQTAEEVMRLEKIKKELQVLDSQFSQDVAVLRGKIDHACLSYAEAEKHYLRVEKEFLQAKIHLQKEKEKKELLTEHLCALITHNETRKAQKLETLMLELATDKKQDINDIPVAIDDDKSVIVDGVDERTGKIVELTPEN